jgi:hypothetical protein
MVMEQPVIEKLVHASSFSPSGTSGIVSMGGSGGIGGTGGTGAQIIPNGRMIMVWLN